jgi:hypothetical protein
VLLQTTEELFRLWHANWTMFRKIVKYILFVYIHGYLRYISGDKEFELSPMVEREHMGSDLYEETLGILQLHFPLVKFHSYMEAPP